MNTQTEHGRLAFVYRYMKRTLFFAAALVALLPAARTYAQLADENGTSRLAHIYEQAGKYDRQEQVGQSQTESHNCRQFELVQRDLDVEKWADDQIYSQMEDHQNKYPGHARERWPQP